MATRILDVFESSGDANLGLTLLRLARHAETAHCYKVAEEARQAAMAVRRRVEGLDPSAVVSSVVPPARRATDARASHRTEAAR